MIRSRLLRALFLFVVLCGILAWVLPWFLYAMSAAFPTRLAATLLFSAVISEKLWSSLLRMPDKVAVAADKDWTVAAVGLAYAVVIFTVLLDIYTRRAGLPSLTAALGGGLVYSSGVYLRQSALRHLGRAWSIQLDRADSSNRFIVRNGPYRWIRHPIYTGAMIETLGFALLFDSGWALLAALLLFCPAELARARFEEGYLSAQFGDLYVEYAREVPGFIPWIGTHS